MTFEDQAARILDSISFFGSGTEKQADQQRADAEDGIAAALRAERERALEEAEAKLREGLGHGDCNCRWCQALELGCGAIRQLRENL